MFRVREIHPLNFKVEQIQHKRLHRSFHTGKISCKGLEFNYIYDCGNPNDIRNYLDKVNKVDLIFVSHFDSDHVQGLISLFSNNKQKIEQDEIEYKYKLEKCKIILPYISDVDKFLPFLIDNENDGDNKQSKAQEYLEFIQDKRIIWIRKSNLEPFPGYNNNRYISVYENEVRMDSLGQEINDKDIIQFKFDKSDINWIFLPHVYKREEIYEKICIEIESNSNLKYLKDWLDGPKNNLDEAVKFLTQLQMDLKKNPKWKKIFYASTGDNKPANLISMSLYSGPDLGINILNNYFHLKDHLHNDRVGWLHTGDANLKDSDRRTEFNEHYKYLKKNVGIISLPHHGSSNNFHLDIMPDNFCNSVIAPFGKSICSNTLKETNKHLEKTPTEAFCTMDKDFTIECIGNIYFSSYLKESKLANCKECELYNPD